MNTLIVWYDATKTSLYQVPSELLAFYDPADQFKRCHSYLINGGNDPDEETSDRIEYLAWLLGEEPHYGAIPPLDEWLQVSLEERQERKRNPLGDKPLAPREGSPTAPPLAKFKLDGTECSCSAVINTGWFV